MRLLGLIGLMLFFSGISIAQKGRAYWKDDTILIGERAELVVEFENINQKLRAPRLDSPLKCGWRQSNENLFKQNGEVEILSANRTNNQKERSVQFVYQVTAWDSAIYQLPEMEFVLFDKSTGKRDTAIFIQSPELSVVFKKEKIQPAITEVEVAPEFSLMRWLKSYGWIIAVGLIIPIGIYFWNRRKRHQFVSKETLKARSIKKLNELRKKEYWKKNKVEQHYVEFTFLLRSFLSERYAHSFLEKTSFECRMALKTFGADAILVNRVAELLAEADLAKFGKTVPSEETTLLSLNKLEEIIIELSPLDIPTA